MTATRPSARVLPGKFVSLEPIGRADLPELFEAIGQPKVFAGGFGGGPLGYRSSVEEFVEWGGG